jgi:hypothetical protein
MKDSASAYVHHTREWLVLWWSIEFGYYYVGPFQDAPAAGAWADENQGTDVRWQVVLADPALSLPVRDPGPMPPLQPDPEPDPDTARMLNDALGYEPLPAWLGNSDDYTSYDHWAERQGPTGDFYLLMVCADPLHLVGPFPDHRHAYSWGMDYMARTDDEHWWVVWLDDPGRAPVLRRPRSDRHATGQPAIAGRRRTDVAAADRKL